jgi:hypothetical protein
MKRFVVSTSILIGLVAGCGPKLGSSRSSSYGSTGGQTTTETVAQRSRNGNLICVIAWTAKHGGGSTTYSEGNRLTKIHNHPVHPRFDRRAVYAFQPDGSLKPIPLTEGQVNSLFREMQDDSFEPSRNELWQKAIVPHLVIVEATNGS